MQGEAGGQVVELQDFRQLSEALFDADVCIVGAGPAGLAIARELADTRCRVLMIESGGSEPSLLTRDLDLTQNVGAARQPDPALVRARAFGGSSSVWNGRCGVLDASDMEARDWVPLSGWPLSHRQLSPYFVRAAEQLGLCATDYDAGLEARQPYASPLTETDALRSYLWQFSVDEQDSSVAMRCARGMRQRDPANLRVLLHATVTELLPDASGEHIESLEIRSLTGKQAEVRARVFVLCAGGIETPRLLLASRRVLPFGVGNQHGLVGRHLMDHARCSLGELRLPEAARLRPAFSLQRQNYEAESRPRYFLRGLALTAACQRREQLLGCAGWLHETEAADDPWSALKRLRQTRSARDVVTVLRQPLLTLQQLRRKLLQRQPVLRKLASLELICDVEQGPDPDSRISLSDACDALGMPRARIDWRISELQKHTLLRFAQHAEAAFSTLGQQLSLPEHVRDAQIDVAQLRDVAHPSGTTRMADSPLRGVVDSSGQVHGIDGLYIAGTSVFPTQGHVNPTLSLVALAIHIADQLKARHFAQRRPPAHSPRQDTRQDTRQDMRPDTTEPSVVAQIS